MGKPFCTIPLYMFFFLLQKVLENKPTSKQCDVYSYGIVVWELLTHKIPFEDVTDVLDLCKNVAMVSIGNHSGVSLCSGFHTSMLLEVQLK